MNSAFLNSIKRKCKRILYHFSTAYISRHSIDWGLVENEYRKNGLKKITEFMERSFQSITLTKDENSEYFNHILHYIGKAKFLKKNPFYLYPSNVAVIDFLLKNASKNDAILDYGCGLGNLIVYLKEMGFKNVYGYDNFSQIKSETVSNFLKEFNCEKLILKKKQVLFFPTSIAMCSGYFWEKLGDDILEKEQNNKKLDYILIDYDYVPQSIPGFKVTSIYNNLLVVFSRK